MFTGIIQTRGRVARLRTNSFGVRLTIAARGWRPRGGKLLRGDSVCVSGVCLTVANFSAQGMEFDVIAETLAKTTLGDLSVGDEVNLEPALAAGAPLGGHFLQGHTDGVGTVTRVLATDAERRVTVKPPPGLMKYVTPKGSIAIDGVSLTLAGVRKNNFDVALIPITLEITTLGAMKAGGRVNLEADILAKTLVHYLETRPQYRRGATPSPSGRGLG